MNTKKLLTLSLYLIIATISSLSAQAVGDKFKVGQLYYQITNLSPNQVAVVPQNTSYPSYWNDNEQPIGEITIPTSIAHNETTYSVTSIGKFAFNECTGLSTVNIPNSVTSIGEGAFQQCQGLTSVNIPNSVTNIGKSAFDYCIGLTSITIPNSVTKIGEWSFNECTGLTNVNIPNSVTSIGEGAFQQCQGLTSIIIPNSITSIREWAFAGCTGLTNITVEIADLSQLIIGMGLFHGVDKNNCLLFVPQGKVADYQAAEQWKEFTKIEEIGKPLVGDKFKVGQLYFQITNLSPNQVAVVSGNEEPTGEITIPICITHNETTYSVTNIRDWAFFNYTGLTSVTIPKSVTSIGNFAFYNCTGLTSLNIPNSITSIGKWAFSECTGLTAIHVNNQNTNYTDVEGVLFNKDKTTLIAYPNAKAETYTIPNFVTRIEQSAFSGCKRLTAVTIPNSVTNIGDWAFAYCTGLTKITSEIADLSQLTIGRYLFYGVNQNKCLLYVPQGTVADYQAAAQWKAFTNIKEIEINGISQVDAERYIALYPNPAREKVTLHIAPALVEQVSSLTLLDSNGKALQRQPITGSETNIDLTHCTSGIYFVQIDNVVKKLIIK